LISIADKASLWSLDERMDATALVRFFWDKTRECKKEPSDGSASTLNPISSLIFFHKLLLITKDYKLKLLRIPMVCKVI
jgi:hypothetical protein